jgi:hypothetical protein
MRTAPLLLLLACAGDDEKGDTDPPVDTDPTGTPDCVASYTDDLGPEPAFARPLGEIVVNNDDYFPHVLGGVAEAPPLSFHVEADREGACRLVTWAPTSCTPACDFGAFCVDGECVTHPPRVDAGPLTLTGEGLDLVVPVDATSGWYAELPAPVTGGITASAAGGEAPAFTVGSCAVNPIVPTGDWSALLAARADGQDVTLEWSPVDPSARISLHMTTGVATHGGVAHAEIECEGPDTGALAIPGRFLDALYAEGWSCGECGNNTLYRYRSGEVDAGGAPVRLTVRTGASFWHIPGRSR